MQMAQAGRPIDCFGSSKDGISERLRLTSKLLDAMSGKRKTAGIFFCVVHTSQILPIFETPSVVFSSSFFFRVTATMRVKRTGAMINGSPASSQSMKHGTSADRDRERDRKRRMADSNVGKEFQTVRSNTLFSDQQWRGKRP